jgi:hypothetical protein
MAIISEQLNPEISFSVRLQMKYLQILYEVVFYVLKYVKLLDHYW